MSLRTRILLGSVLLILVPLALFAWGVRGQMQRRLSAQFTERAATLMTIIQEDLAAEAADIQRRLDALTGEIDRDNTWRLAIGGGRDDLLPYLRDYAGRAMRLTGLDMLQIQDDRDRIVSSGHYRNEYDRRDPYLAELVSSAPNRMALVAARSPTAEFLALSGATGFSCGGRAFTIVGGLRFDEASLQRLTRDRELAVSVVFAGGAFSSDPELAAFLQPTATEDSPEGVAGTAAAAALRRAGHLVQAAPIPLIRAGHRYEAALIVSHPSAPLAALLHRVNLWLAAALILTAIGSVALAVWVSDRISRPLRRLAQQTARLDLGRLDVDFNTDGHDEVGRLGRLLQELTGRLRASLARVTEAERRATLGEVARQVNHDIRNGLTPLRNVVRHLAQLAEQAPDDLPAVFRERRETLEQGLAYLDDLATHYRRLGAAGQPQPCDLAAIVRAAAAGLSVPDTGHIGIATELQDGLPPVMADPIALRRIVDNLTRNALESLPDSGGTVTLSVRRGQNSGEPTVVLSVADTGAGIAPEDRQRIFDDFFTTRPDGSGLGLSNVRRLAADCGATVEVASEPGRGSIFSVHFVEQGAAPDDVPPPPDTEREP